MARKTLIFALLALLAITACAQQFEWAKSYYGYGDEYVNIPRGLVADSEGNTYRLMQVGRGGTLDGVDPFDDITNHNFSLLLVKMSPDGQHLWHRIINPWERGGGSGVTVHDLRMLGDTALMMMVDMPLPLTIVSYGTPQVQTKLYYLDTMLTTSETLMPTDSINNWRVTAFITMGLDGTLLEHHFLQVTYLDSLGLPVTRGQKVYGNNLTAQHFDVDSRGNIYVVRHTQDNAFSGLDPMYFYDGGLSGYRFMVDGTRFHTHIPPYHTGLWNQQVLKFSPHFDSLLDASYLAGDAPWVDPINTPWMDIKSFDIHEDDQLYFTFNIKVEHDSIPIARSNGLVLQVDTLSLVWGTDCMLRLDTGLNANLLMQFNCVPYDGGYPSVVLSATCVDTATGSLFVLGAAGTDGFTGNDNPHQIVYRGDTLDNRNDAFWLRVGIDDGHYLSYGRMHSSWGASRGGLSIAARNNRVFTQVAYSGSVFFADTLLTTQGAFETGLALAQWDYDGHEVAIYPFHCIHPDSKAGHLLLTDTAVFVTGNSFSTPTTFGDIFCGNGQYIAKLVDTSMRSPYVYPDLHADQTIIWPGGNTLRIPNPGSNPDLPLNASASSGLPVVYTVSDPSMVRVSLNGGGGFIITALCSQGVFQVTASQPGTSYWNPASLTKTLVIGNVGIHEFSILNSQFSIYPNPTYGKVTISTHESIVSAFLTDLSGRREEVRLTPTGFGQYTLDLTTRPQATYLLTLTTASGKTHTVRLLKQSDIFSR